MREALRRLGFRFAFAYFALFCFPWPLPKSLWKPAREWIVTTVATHVLQVPVSIKPTGSGDAAQNWIYLGTLFTIAVIAACIWMLVDRREHPRLREALRVYVRFFVAVEMLSYGAAKVIPSQFGPPDLDRLVTTYGASSPMGLLWTFMGVSTGYVVFTGLLELAGGLLVAFRRTMLLGALITAGVMSNVVALNFFYDVPVKIFSAHLLIMALWLAIPDLPRLFAFFTTPSGEPRIAVVLTALIIVIAAAIELRESAASRAEEGASSPRSPLRGVWRVDELTENGVARPALITDTMRWRRIVFDDPYQASIFLMSDEKHRYWAEYESGALSLRGRDDKKERIALHYTRPRPDALVLDGTVRDKPIHAVCTLEPEKEYLLTTRGFHWVNEYSFYR